MKRQLLFLLFYLALLQVGLSQTQAELDALKASSPLFQSKYFKVNVWDVQRSPASAIPGQPWRLRNFKPPYDSQTSSPIDWGALGDRYLAFDIVYPIIGFYNDDIFGSGGNFDVVLKLFESDGTYVKDLCRFGVFMGFGEKGFLFEQDGRYGTFFANDSYSLGGGVEYIPTTGVLYALSEITSYKYSPQLLKPTAAISTFTYTGEEQGVSLATNPAYTISGSLSAVNVGMYTVTISLNDKVNDCWSDGTVDDVTITWSITKGTYDLSNVRWVYSEPFTWDGTPQTVSLTGLPKGVTVKGYEGNTATTVGSYTATAVLDYDDVNHHEPVVPELRWAIKSLSVSKPVVNVGSLTYNGEIQGVSIVNNGFYTVSGVASAVNAGEYAVTVSLNDKVNSIWNDGNNDDYVINWNIAKAHYGMSAARWDYVEPFTWDGNLKTVLVIALPAGVVVSSYTGNSAIHAGSYTATALLDYDGVNYNEPVFPELDWVIKTGYLNLSIIKLWDNVLAVSNGDKYDDIRNANFQWYRDGKLLQGNQQYIRFDGSIPTGLYEVEIVVGDIVAITLSHNVASGNVAKAYPNPLQAGRPLTIELGEERPVEEQAEVLNISGLPVKAVVERQASGYRILGLDTPGAYLVRVYTPGETIVTLKFLVK